MFSLLFYGNYAIRAHSSAESTTYTFTFILHISGRIALLIELVVRNSKTFFGTCVNAQSTALTHICIKGYLCHLYSPFTVPYQNQGRISPTD